MANGSWTWRDNDAVARSARWLLYVHVAVSAPLGVLMWRALTTLDVSLLEAAATLAMVRMLVFLVAGIVVLRWVYVANANARALGADDLPGSPALAVAWFFIPLLHLVMPFTTIRDMWKASAGPRDWQAAPSSPVIGLWWAFWIGIQIGSAIELVITQEAKESGMSAAAALPFSLMSILCSMGAALCFAWIIGRIQEMQARGRPAAVFG